MEKIEFGPEIAGVFDGNQFPEGLAIGDECMIAWPHDGDLFSGPYEVPNIWAHEGSRFKVRADHPIYATASAPESRYVVYSVEYSDYVVGKVYEIVNAKIIGEAGDPRTWFRDETRPATPAEIEQYKAEKGLEARYERAAGNIPTPVETVTLPKMTEEEVRVGYMKHFDACSDRHSKDDCVAYLKELGLIKSPPSLLEQFEEHHGGLDNNQRDIIEVYAAWVAGL